MQEHMPGGAYADDKQKATRCKLWMPRDTQSAAHTAAASTAPSAAPPPSAAGAYMYIMSCVDA